LARAFEEGLGWVQRQSLAAGWVRKVAAASAASAGWVNEVVVARVVRAGLERGAAGARAAEADWEVPPKEGTERAEAGSEGVGWEAKAGTLREEEVGQPRAAEAGWVGTLTLVRTVEAG
jgi:hypothetical protein